MTAALWVSIGILVLIVFYLLDREIYFYEGIHLGPRVQAWLYDRWAKGYDKGKAESQLQDADMLARPILNAMNEIPESFVLDLATGTGRLPLALLKESDFKGHIIAIDVSQGMLEQAAQKLAPHNGRFDLLRLLEFPLPFPNDSFDVVGCMEALEVMPEMETPLKEIHRVLRPGGFFLTSRGTEASGRTSKVLSRENFKSVLEGKGFERVTIVQWWKWFDRATARKPGQLIASSHRALAEVLKCPSCGKVAFEKAESGLRCKECGGVTGISQNGIIEL